jgi:hypothetical protein
MTVNSVMRTAGGKNRGILTGTGLPPLPERRDAPRVARKFCKSYPMWIEMWVVRLHGDEEGRSDISPLG